jgi:translation initiation factor 5A
MSGISMAEIGKMKVGRYIVINGEPHQITSMSKSAPGKHGHAKYRVDAKNIFTGQTSNLVMTAHKYVEVPNLKKQNAQVLSVSGTNAQIMDMETYETFDLEIPEELQGQVESGKTIMYWEIMGKRIMKQMVTLK